MADNKPEEKKSDDTDKELSDLLDSALADFSKDASEDKSVIKKDVSGEEEVEEVPSLDQEWNQDFIKQISEQFQSGMAALLGEANGTGAENVTQDQIQASLQKMAEAAQQVFQSPSSDSAVSNDISSTISQTIQGLSEGTESLQNPFNDSDILNMFSNLQGEGEQNSFLPFMEGMMQSLLSKDVLYPSLHDIIGKFPVWLEENDSKLNPEDKERYTKQLELMQHVCEELEKEKDNDPADVRSARFSKVLGMMQTLQNYGQPPVEIVGDVGAPGLPFDNPDQCCVM